MPQSIQNFKRMLSGIDMTEGKPWKKLLLFTVPLLIGNLFQQMYSTADAIILGRFVGDHALAAVGASMSIFFLIMVIMMGISMGVGVMVAQYFGAKKREELSRTIGAAITITLILGAVMMASGPFVTRPLLVLLQTPEYILDDSVMYMNVMMLGILGLAFFNIFSGILRGLGDAFSPLVYLAIASVINVILNLILIPGLGLGVWGAAIGTVFAQGLTSILCLRRLIQMSDVFDMGVKYLRPKKEYIHQVLKLGVPTAASQAIFAIAMMVIQPLSNGMDYLFPGFLAANLIVMRIDGFVMMPNFSFGNAMTVYAGQNMGAGRVDRLGIGVRQCALMAFGTAVIMIGIILLFGRHIAGVFTDTPEVIDIAMRGLRILAIGYIIFAVNMVLWGVIRGAGDAITPMWGAIINTAVVRVPTAYVFVHFMGRPEALFYSLLAAWVSNAAIGALAYRFGSWRNKGIVNKSEMNKSEVKEGRTSMDFFEAVAKRYSHKEEFAPTPVPLEVLEKIAQAGLDAPNGRNNQVVRLVILPNEEALQPLRDVAKTSTLGTAPSAIAVFTDCNLTPQGSKVVDAEDYSAATAQMLLAATALGYSGLWLDSPYWGEENQKKACEVLGVPEGYHLWCVIPVGLPKGETARRTKMLFAERVSYVKFGNTSFNA